MISALKEQLAIDLNGVKEDFEREENVVKILSPSPLKRRNINDGLLLFMACFGKATVAAVNRELETFMTTYIADMAGFRCFDMPLNVLEKELKKHGAIISEIEEFYLLDRKEIQPLNPTFEFEILEGEAIKKIYGDHRFHMALGYSQESIRRDMLAVVCENFFKGIGGKIDEFNCHTLEFYYRMKFSEEDFSRCKQTTDNGEELVWLPIEEIETSKIKPEFIKEKIHEILGERKTIHVIEERDR